MKESFVMKFISYTVSCYIVCSVVAGKSISIEDTVIIIMLGTSFF